MSSHESTNQPLSLPGSFQPAADSSVRNALALTGTLPLVRDAGLPGPHPNAGPTLAGLLQALRRRWLLALVLGVLGAAAAAALVWMVLPPQYTASARLRVASRSISHFLTPNDDETDFVLFKQNQVAVITSSPVLGNALNKDSAKDLQLVREKTNPIPWLEKALKVDFLVSPEIMRVSLGSTQPEELAPLVNAVVDSYLQEIETNERAQRNLLLVALKENQTKEENRLKASQGTLRNMEKNEGLEDQATMKAKLTASLTELAQMKKEHRELLLKINDARNISSGEVELQARQDPAVLDLVKKRGEVQKTVAEIRRTALPRLQDSLLEGPNRELQALDTAYEALLGDLRPSIEKKLRERGDTKAKFLEDQEKALRDGITALDLETRRIKRATVEVEAERRRIQQTETALFELGKQISFLSVEPALGNRISKIQAAETPRTRDLTKSLLFAGAGGIGTFGLLLLGVALLEFRVRRINTPEEVEQALGLPLVGTLPVLPPRARRPLPTGSEGKELYWQGMMNEAVDAIRTLLLHAARSQTLQVVMVTSAEGGEGKTSVASHLAASLARAWRKTLLVDGDLRNPAAHGLFDLPLEPGFSEVLRGEVTMADAIRPTPLSRLWLMPAGNWDSHAVQALAQEGVKAQFDQLKQQYDFIIVDSCPVLPVADSLLLGQHVDAVIFSILRDVSRVPAVQAAQQRLAGLGIRTLGAVVIGGKGYANSASYNYPGVAIR